MSGFAVIAFSLDEPYLGRESRKKQKRKGGVYLQKAQGLISAGIPLEDVSTDGEE
jgi:hypothetical protein